MNKPKRFASVWDAIEDSPEKAANLKVRSELITKIKALIRLNGWTQSKAASLCGQTQPRISDLLRGRVSRFSLDTLVNITAALERHAKPQEGSAMECTEEEGQRLVAEFMAKLAARPVKGMYDLATRGARTWLGNVVHYPDGTESKIVSGAGAAMAYMGRPMAIVGSATDNGDTITSSLQSAAQIREYADDDGIPGLLQPGYVASTGGHA